MTEPPAIGRDIDIDAPIDVVWQTITEPEQIRRWFSDRVDLDATPGALGSFTFGPETEPGALVVGLTVVAVEAPRLFSFRWCYPPGVTATPDNSVLVTFTLRARGPQQTALRVEETGLERLDWPAADKQRFADEHRDGWQTQGDRLRALYLPQPHTSP